MIIDLISKILLFLGLTLVGSVCLAQEPVKMGKLTSAALTEVSGIIPSYRNDASFWVHNDSGDQSAIYLINDQAKLKAIVELEGLNLVDAEDIARLQIGGRSYLLLADMGNNVRDRDTLSLFLFEEPAFELGRDRYQVSRKQIREIKFRYKDKRRDAEALFVDPVDNSIYIISKRDFKSTVFKLSVDAFQTEVVHELSPQLELPFNFVTAADISADGRHILIKNLTNVFLWQRQIGENPVAALERAFKRLSYEIEPQGEAICFDSRGRFFYTISERPFGLDAYLYKYKY